LLNVKLVVHHVTSKLYKVKITPFRRLFANGTIDVRRLMATLSIG
jgi:hypothetical protein